MGALTASISHEINQPLAAIVANSNAAERWLSAKQPNLDEARAALKRIGEDSNRASQIIGSLYAMFKKDGGQRGLVAVNSVIDDTLMLVRSAIQKHEVFVQAELLQDLPQVVGDRTQLQQVFINLILNALDAMDLIARPERRLAIKSTLGDGGFAIVEVEDSGVGIDPANAERIFEAFFSTKASGMGMGLSICRSIIEAHGGSLWASWKMPHGSVFHVRLPTADVTSTLNQ
jgi:C4-dicarboxylate-specific signal transduction histidine kinase